MATFSNSRLFAPLIAVCLGGLLPLALAPFNFWPLGMLSCAGLFCLWERLPQRCAAIGWWFGVGKYGVGASWVYVSIHDHGNASVPLALALVALFVAGMSLFMFTQGFCYQRARRWAGGLAVPLLFVVFWVTWEWLLTWVLTGLPWLFLGYGHLDTPLGNLAPMGGVLLVSLGVALSSCVAVFVYQQVRRSADLRSQWLPLAGALVLVTLPWVVGAALSGKQWVELGEPRTAALVQNNVPQNQKWLPEQRVPIVRAQEQLTAPHWGADLVLWPEAAVTMYEHQAETLLARWNARGQRANTTLVLGIPYLQAVPQADVPAGVQFFNAAIAVGNGQGRYLKQQLVPFGEYVPLEGLLRGVIDFFDLPMSNSGVGPVNQPLLGIGDHFASMAICYEIAFPALVAQQLMGGVGNVSAGQVAQVILTISNDAWFGTSLGPDQHLQIAQMRARENGRFVLRSTQTGFTAIINHRGEVQDQLPRFEAGVLAGEYRPATGLTPFTRYGHLPLLGFLVLLAAVVVSLRGSVANP